MKKKGRPIKKPKAYLIISKRDNFLFGAFPYTSEGLSKAKAYLIKIGGDKNFFIDKK
jgi:hypothetical protein